MWTSRTLRAVSQVGRSLPTRALSTQRVPVCISMKDLISGKADFPSLIQEAYGPTGLGLLTIKDIPSLPSKREKLLRLARELALLSDEEKAMVELPDIGYAIGWSHGKEQFNGKPDFSKGSFYANPEYDSPLSSGNGYHPNVWPQQIPLEAAFKDMGEEVIQVGKLLAQHIDAYLVAEKAGYQPDTLLKILETSKSHIGRLLHYFPHDAAPGAEDSAWCGWHNDHGALTGLLSAMWLDQATGEEVSAAEATKGTDSGLFVRTRLGEMVKVSIPPDQIAFQMGETTQILSGGLLQATPHYVAGGQTPNLGRNTFAVFMEPGPDYMLEVSDSDKERVFIEVHEQVPPLKNRFQSGITFGEFHHNTISGFS